ncbi:ABC transporter substrate-binding protein [Sporomusa sp. KB1]|jgi:ABC-type nitrate/sulfonate/bicarbonate transport system substrate-binding protein|uniref:ABC transporter substrate-binding protein n=1 Tax=Sporomusa sp. KB1 TaxID=943346 RepID=UPI0011AA601E|nr:ABC transporter substrate-binding protein [Sporomusa sp. KB1]TWH47528.1 ABC-type nitrate/sulfonate/bicarbonate transport system substrate-binding protein [Sporomusa sp. KB1]
MKRIVVVITLMLSILLVAGCSKTVDEGDYQFQNGKLSQEFHLKVIKGGAFDYAMADLNGFFKDVGIVTDYQGPLKGGTLVQSVVKGDLDIMHSGHVINVAMARQAGMKIKIVMEGMVDHPDSDKGHMYWLIQDNGKINSPQDLIGKKIAVANRGSCVDLLTYEYLRQNGIQKDQVELLTMPDVQQEQALRQGLIDVAVVHSTYSIAAQQRPGLKVLVSSYQIGVAAGDGEAGGLAVRAFSEDFIKKYPGVVKAYIAGNYRGQQWGNKNFEEAKQLWAKFNDAPLSGGNWHATDKWVDEKKIQFWIDMMERNGFAKPGEINAKDLYTNDLNPFYTGELKE